MAHEPEQLNLWDRLFNRYRKEVANRGVTLQKTTPIRWGQCRDDLASSQELNWVEYRIIDRLTGSETIKREYLTATPSYD